MWKLWNYLITIQCFDRALDKFVSYDSPNPPNNEEGWICDSCGWWTQRIELVKFVKGKQITE